MGTTGVLAQNKSELPQRMIFMNLAFMIRTKGLQLKMTQEQMAGRLGVTAPAVYKWKHGAAYPDLQELVGGSVRK